MLTDHNDLKEICKREVQEKGDNKIMENLEVKKMDVEEIENYFDLIQEIKKRLSIDGGRKQLPEGTINLMRECKQEIINLRTGINKMIDENIEIKEDCIEMAGMLYKYEMLENIENETVKKNVSDFFELYENDKLFMIKDNIDRVVKLFSEMV